MIHPIDPVGDSDGSRLDDAIDVLSNSTRRRLLYFLREHERSDLHELTDVVTDWSVAGEETETSTPSERDRVYVDLYHVQVPKLVDQGIVSADFDGGTVTLERVHGRLDRLLDITLELETNGGDGSFAGSGASMP